PAPAQALSVKSIPAHWESTYATSGPNAGAGARLGASSFTFDESGRDVVSTFNVTFISESRQQWPEDAKKAFMRATKIWSYLFASPVPIDVEAYWSPLEPGILGSARPGGARGGGYFQDFKGAPEKKLWYPAALANAINTDKKDLDDVNPEITARFNSNSLYVTWYFGLDAKPGVRQYDFVTAVLHELGHGLGLISQENFNERLKTFSNNNPTIFSGFVANDAHQSVLNRRCMTQDQLLSRCLKICAGKLRILHFQAFKISAALPEINQLRCSLTLRNNPSDKKSQTSPSRSTQVHALSAPRVRHLQSIS
ncbi:MAG: hypothetical protein EBX92_08625, partial [Actinobacteria bacterium]|nr:hypothetical protein [Actinomycetota bacterium]